MSETYERGLRILRETNPDGPRVMEELAEIAPDFARWIVEFGYGSIYASPRLPLREREIATLASLTTQGGAERQLEYHVATALRVGLRPQEIVETIVNCAAFAGIPRALNGLRVARRAFAKAGVRTD